MPPERTAATRAATVEHVAAAESSEQQPTPRASERFLGAVTLRRGLCAWCGRRAAPRRCVRDEHDGELEWACLACAGPGDADERGGER